MTVAAIMRPVPTEADSPLVSIQALIEQGNELYESGGLPRGSLPGWPSVDELYSVAPGQVTGITGMPQCGKSEFVDAMMVNLAEREPWEFCIYSPENYPVVTHQVKLVEKRVRKPFNKGVTPRMTREEYNRAALWVGERFFWIEPTFKTPMDVIATALSMADRRSGKRIGVVLDPWNTLDHETDGMTGADYLSKVLGGVVKMARASQAHVWLVAHPKLIDRNRSDGKRPVPTPYDISGGAHWFNKLDNIICVHQELAEQTQDVQIHVQKCRFKHIGRRGVAVLKYDKVVGRYFEMPQGVPIVDGEFYADPQRGASLEDIEERLAMEAR